MYLSVIFLKLVELFNQDCCHEDVDQLAAQFVAEISYTLYLTQCKDVKIITASLADIKRYEGVYRFLQSYGIGFVIHPLKTKEQVILGARLVMFNPNEQQGIIRIKQKVAAHGSR